MTRRGGGRAGIRCARCPRLSPIRVDELSGGGEAPSGERLLPVLVPSEHTPDTSFEAAMDWIADPDGDGIICAPATPGGPGCATAEEVAEYLAGLADVDRVLAEIYDEETGLSTGRDDIDHLDFDA